MMKLASIVVALGSCVTIAGVAACKSDDAADESGAASGSSSGQQASSGSSSGQSGSGGSSSSGSSSGQSSSGGSSSSGSSSGQSSSGDAGADAGTSSASFVITGGTFDAVDLEVVDGAAHLFAGMPGEGVQTRLILYIIDRAGLCGTGPRREGAKLFFIDALSGATPFATGTYTQQHDDVPGNVSAGFGVLSDTCRVNADYAATEATVVISEITTTSVKGTFDLTFESDTLQGTFDVPLCASQFDTVCRP